MKQANLKVSKGLMKPRMYMRGSVGVALLAIPLIAGCGGSTQQKQDKDFFTSGNREADQRADQRMAQAQQLTGDNNNGGQKVSTSQAVLSTEKKPLYDRLGGAEGMTAIVDDYVTRALADPRVNWQRVGITHGGLSIHREDSVTWDANPANVKTLKMHLNQFFSLATGGPTVYAGKDMRSAHANMHITNPEFDAAVGDLKATLDKLQIANQEQKELLSVVESTREQIVEDR
jgi:hemoglobin